MIASYRQLDHNEISCIEAEAINGLNRLEIVWVILLFIVLLYFITVVVY
jgi:hypothetical protein